MEFERWNLLIIERVENSSYQSIQVLNITKFFFIITVMLTFSFRQKNSRTLNDNFIYLCFGTASYVGHLNELALWTVFKRLYEKKNCS